jgi:Flp pilus assembly protein TadG
MPHCLRIAPARGVVAVELAIVVTLMLSLVIGIIEVGRVSWLWQARHEAARAGARIAAVCDIGDADVSARMRASTGLSNASLLIATVSWLPASCTVSTCTHVVVEIAAAPVTTLVPLFTFSPTLPAERAILPVESMTSSANALCNAPT